MPKIETPREFVERLPWMSINGKPDFDQWENHLRCRDAAIRAGSAELLRVCGEALGDISKLRGEYAESEDPSAKGFFHMACDKADSALAALKDAGVRV